MRTLLFYIARSKVAATFLTFIFQYLSYLIPVKKIYNSKYIISFKHPVPFCSFHYLIIPKMNLKNIMSIDFSNEDHRFFIKELVNCTNYIVNKFELTNQFICVNYGIYQDVPHLHFHLMQGIGKNKRDYFKESNNEKGEMVDCNQFGEIYISKFPNRNYDWYVELISSRKNLEDDIISLLNASILFLNKKNLSGYSIIVKGAFNESSICNFNLVSGKYLL